MEGAATSRSQGRSTRRSARSRHCLLPKIVVDVADLDPLDVVLQFGAAWGAHDLDAVLALISDDCVFDATGPAPDGARHVGRDAIRAAWGPIFADASSTFDPEDTFTAGDRVVQRWRYSWADGHVRGVDLFRVRDGLVAEKLSYVKG
jgi:ketosteroid isomerase-like protein